MPLSPFFVAPSDGDIVYLSAILHLHAQDKCCPDLPCGRHPEAPDLLVSLVWCVPPIQRYRATSVSGMMCGM